MKPGDLFASQIASVVVSPAVSATDRRTIRGARPHTVINGGLYTLSVVFGLDSGAARHAGAGIGIVVCPADRSPNFGASTGDRALAVKFNFDVGAGSLALRSIGLVVLSADGTADVKAIARVGGILGTLSPICDACVRQAVEVALTLVGFSVLAADKPEFIPAFLIAVFWGRPWLADPHVVDVHSGAVFGLAPVAI